MPNFFINDVLNKFTKNMANKKGPDDSGPFFY